MSNHKLFILFSVVLISNNFIRSSGQYFDELVSFESTAEGDFDIENVLYYSIGFEDISLIKDFYNNQNLQNISWKNHQIISKNHIRDIIKLDIIKGDSITVRYPNKYNLQKHPSYWFIFNNMFVQYDSFEEIFRISCSTIEKCLKNINNMLVQVCNPTTLHDRDFEENFLPQLTFAQMEISHRSISKNLDLSPEGKYIIRIRINKKYNIELTIFKYNTDPIEQIQ